MISLAKKKYQKHKLNESYLALKDKSQCQK